jgi:stress response protein YsnF
LKRGAGNAEQAETTIPVVQEELRVERHQIDTATVSVRKVVEAREVEVDVPLMQQRVQIERVAVNRIVEEMAPPRQEAGKTIVPVYEEVLVKRWLLKEELHISLAAHAVSSGPVQAVLRRETVDVVRTPIAPEEAPDRSTNDSSPSDFPST